MVCDFVFDVDILSYSFRLKELKNPSDAIKLPQRPSNQPSFHLELLMNKTKRTLLPNTATTTLKGLERNWTRYWSINVLIIFSKQIISFSKKVTNRLKGFKNVNQKAAMEYAMTRENVENLSNQMNRMKRSHDNCRDLNENVEKTKNDSVVYSFMQVARSFRNMFRTLVPRPGIGYLKWTYDDSESDDEGEDEPQASIFL